MDKLTIGPKIVFDPAVVGGEVRKAFSMITGKWKLEILGFSISGCIASES